ncbi:TolC family protein [Geobacter pickeringii]|uniref:RND transporter n=1 Tax=Geobacter pickeringii TaxID=345632 RepID=A0A0B5B6L8_9BACT|nr:hypothetical protein [Geobacter pickeringii]AJE02183.1 hypothetical protein GPICK_01250 [Geobacter pickeringii]
MKPGIIGRRLFAFVVVFFMTAGSAGAGEPLRNTAYFYEKAIAVRPTIHDVGERLRIARGIGPDRMAEFSGIHESASFLGDTDSAQDDFRDEAYDQLRAEIRMAYAELASVRGQTDEVRRSVVLLRHMVELSNTLYAGGKIDQAQALQAQIAWASLSENLLVLEGREKTHSIRLNVLTGDAPEDAIPALEPLREYAPAFDSRELAESYKSRRFIVVFQQTIRPDSPVATGDELHGADSLDVESGAFVSAARVSLETLSYRARRYRTELVPRAEQAYASRLEAYKNGRLDLSVLIESLREVSDLRRECQTLLGEIHVRKARLESATGVVLD